MIAFIQAHSVVLAGFLVGTIDLVMALMPNLQSNGILHAVVVFLQSKTTTSVSK